jgi:hypothetical protein
MKRGELGMGCRGVPARQTRQTGGIESLESIPRLIKTLKIPSIGSRICKDEPHFFTCNRDAQDR